MIYLSTQMYSMSAIIIVLDQQAYIIWFLWSELTEEEEITGNNNKPA